MHMTKQTEACIHPSWSTDEDGYCTVCGGSDHHAKVARWQSLSWMSQALIDGKGKILATISRTLSFTWRYNGQEFIDEKSAKSAAERDNT